MSKKLTIEFVRLEFKNEGYILLTEKYTNSSQKLEYICSKGHRHNIRWNDFQQGKRCAYCAGVGKLNIDIVRSKFEERGCLLLSQEYKNNREKLDYICSCGKKHSITYASFYMGHRCPICAMEELSIRYCGVGNPAWNNGSSYEPYCSIWLDKEFKESIKERDNYQCQNPDCWGTSVRLAGHHIDYNKKNCDPSNIITLCNSCNGRANENREYWQKFYTGIMLKRGVMDAWL